ncbi:MAG: ribose 5-phosphate isomerase B [Mesoaciditoga sp.]|uniref:ribose 5-phosphate isomerase B n=1 Tax=Athalassotoga sp. TaxID=2022597 RepID=UPI000CBFB4EA|nr:MAG: ribose 5-phosphate isomerase B [Mesoaciditoga sp.]PMP79619.1 MAG: ribose 5-phosphate isomerase B [Mesoaciditoga sp.]HEU24551.1 ribose 5-phosphate isomerase B [Mesoaciditoga lauensis]
MKISIGSDHAGFELKEHVKKYLESKGIEVVDEGTYSPDSVDYPVFAGKVAKDLQNKMVDYGILICGTGLGMSITANKFKNIYAALCLYPTMAKYARMHNNANILVMAGRLMGPTLAEETVDTFLSTNFEGGRHQRRIDEIKEIEK